MRVRNMSERRAHAQLRLWTPGHEEEEAKTEREEGDERVRKSRTARRRERKSNQIGWDNSHSDAAQPQHAGSDATDVAQVGAAPRSRRLSRHPSL